MTTWGSKNAEGLFRIAVNIAGFPAGDLMAEIHRRQRDNRAQVNERTVLQAMQTVKDGLTRSTGRRE